ncbi:MAG TPA: hypothetical protein IAA69_08345 [Candidatus Aveggerthella stercoripullorum]|uniref:Uncharacterized protein n=1 Tax=Candidatus Aveggerthella stercoripullorum TaxID=2840688 RepID=A0A9D1D4D2_9ACTN|nr:hypothetical protein [Candidatus Aveggerthella stercoripullorum]
MSQYHPQRMCGRRAIAHTARREDVAKRIDLSGPNQGVWPIAAYLCLTLALLYLMQPWFSYPAFFRLGPLCIEPSDEFSLCMQIICCALGGWCGAAYIVGHDATAGLAEASLGAALSATSAIGAYLLCYTLLNTAFRIAFLLAATCVTALILLNRKAAEANGAPWLASVGFAKPVLYLMTCVGFVTCAFPSWSLSAYSYELAFPDDRADRMLAANIDSAATFFNGDFERQPLAERADSAGSIVLVEANYLGVNGPIEISVEACTGKTVAYYDASSNKIALNPAYLMTQDGGDCVEAAAHEVAHAFQWQSCSGALPTDTVTGWPGGFPDVETRSVWARELSGYVSSAFDLSGYMSQSIEQTAYQYGYLSAADIEARVGKYLETGNPEP